ncbi:hypothetical protein IU449_00945 [Nocardia higoensis]|uniref:Protein kinase n=1 Tax=Nocardia higoensis TaxID=228599 RepID=A0ABS0D8N2_9NOCA|nr:DUF6764 family protein [Nocardia higoensis]MBF6353128.1 hypothetical protein [Nocardia higoensis]
MKFVDAIVCATAAVGAASVFPAAASASAVHCAADSGIDAMAIDGETGCRAVGSVGGRAHSAGLDGVGYAGAAFGSQAIGVGVAGGVGASDGVEGMALAAGFGPDALASNIGADREPDKAPSTTVAIAFAGSRAEVVGGFGGSVVCLGAGAVAWDERSGAACLATPFGVWKLSGESPSGRLR